jgi:hypothetical protein
MGMRGHSKSNLGIAIIFLLAIFLPGIFQAFLALDPSIYIEEKRNLTEKPSFNFKEVSDYPARFQSYFNDHFGFRNLLIRWHNLLKLQIFNSSGSPKVIVGKEGWLFYNGDQARDGASLSNHLGLLPFAYEEEFKKFRDDLEKKVDYLAKLGIGYFFVG